MPARITITRSHRSRTTLRSCDTNDRTSDLVGTAAAVLAAAAFADSLTHELTAVLDAISGGKPPTLCDPVRVLPAKKADKPQAG